jgi:rubrerythrin
VARAGRRGDHGQVSEDRESAANEDPMEDEPGGGEAVCWLGRVCDECGALADDRPPTSCPRCGASITTN